MAVWPGLRCSPGLFAFVDRRHARLRFPLRPRLGYIESEPKKLRCSGSQRPTNMAFPQMGAGWVELSFLLDSTTPCFLEKATVVDGLGEGFGRCRRGGTPWV